MEKERVETLLFFVLGIIFCVLIVGIPLFVSGGEGSKINASSEAKDFYIALYKSISKNDLNQIFSKEYLIKVNPVDFSTLRINSSEVVGDKSKGCLYFMFSPTCPHCSNAKRILKKLEKVADVCVVYLGYEDALKFIKIFKEKYNITYGGVPLIFAFTRDGSEMIALYGFPSKYQEGQGFFAGREEEEKFCLAMGGTTVKVDGKYFGCYMKREYSFVGQPHLLIALIKYCELNGCRAVGLS